MIPRSDYTHQWEKSHVHCPAHSFTRIWYICITMQHVKQLVSNWHHTHVSMWLGWFFIWPIGVSDFNQKIFIYGFNWIFFVLNRNEHSTKNCSISICYIECMIFIVFLMYAIGIFVTPFNWNENASKYFNNQLARLVGSNLNKQYLHSYRMCFCHFFKINSDFML